MNHFWSYVFDHLPALMAAISAFVAAWKSNTAVKVANRVQAAQVMQIVQATRTASSAAPSAAEDPGVSIADVLRYWDLATKLREGVRDLRSLPTNVPGEVPLIRRVRIDGRKADLGPTPIVFRD